MEPYHHSLANLTFRLVKGLPSLEPLQVLEEREITWQGHSVTLRILGASHAVTVDSEDEKTTELLSCGGVEGTSETLIEAPAHLQGAYESCTNGLIWKTTLAPFLLEEGESLQGRFEETLSHEFPATAESIPITRIGWNAGRMLYIQTIHTYPQEGLGVRSITFIRKERGA